MRKAAEHLKKSDPVMAGIIARVGPCRIQYREPEFASLARAIVFQQLNGKAAARIYERVAEAVGGRMTPAAVLRTRTRKLRSAGLSAQKAGYMLDLARHTVGGKISFSRLSHMNDAEVIETLTQVKGIGEWSAQMFLLFALRRPDVLATGDYGVRAAIRRAYQLPELPPPRLVEEMGRPWRPFASAACWYLWRFISLPAEP